MNAAGSGFNGRGLIEKKDSTKAVFCVFNSFLGSFRSGVFSFELFAAIADRRGGESVGSLDRGAVIRSSVL
jgi:hypothetical protein